MKSLLAIIITAAVCISSTSAADADWYKQREFSVGSYYEFQVEDLGHLDHARGNGIGVGATYYHTENIGVAVAALADEHWHGVVDQLRAGIRLRVPFGRLAPYALADAAYDLRRGGTSYQTGGGLEFRFTPSLGAFGEAAYEFHNDRDDDLVVRAGLRLSF